MNNLTQANFIADKVTRKYLNDCEQSKTKEAHLAQLDVKQMNEHIFLITVKYNIHYSQRCPTKHLEKLNSTFKELHNKITCSIISGNRSRKYYQHPFCWVCIDAPGTRHGAYKPSSSIIEADHHHAICLIHPETLERFNTFRHSLEFNDYVAKSRDFISVDIQQLENQKDLKKTADYCTKHSKKYLNSLQFGDLVEMVLPDLDPEKLAALLR